MKKYFDGHASSDNRDGAAFHHFSNHESSSLTRLALIIVLAVLVHLTVKAILRFREVAGPQKPRAEKSI